MEGINSPLTLHDHSGKPVSGEVKTGFFIKIELPGIKTENWLQVTGIKDEPQLAGFGIHPRKMAKEKYPYC